MKLIITIILPAVAFLWAFKNLPAPASGWRGGLGRFLHSTMLAILAWLVARTLP
ncbi:hypothetical protein NKJ13_08025 [Mesorhizobium sp. M0174]|uniref:hypothetical protein n=1 Tax=Mesorhizobium sp. M0174 TaxID=2956904 RepID=UPI003335FBD5